MNGIEQSINKARKVKSAWELPRNGGFINSLTELYCKWKPLENH